jgi:hypothetical protein
MFAAKHGEAILRASKCKVAHCSPTLTTAPIRPSSSASVKRHKAPLAFHLSQQRRVLRTASSTCPLYKSSLPTLHNWSSLIFRRRSLIHPVMARKNQEQAREHSGHHHHDNSYLISQNKNDAGVRITRIGLYVNLGMAIGKGVGGYAFNSQGTILNLPDLGLA